MRATKSIPTTSFWLLLALAAGCSDRASTASTPESSPPHAATDITTAEPPPPSAPSEPQPAQAEAVGTQGADAKAAPKPTHASPVATATTAAKHPEPTQAAGAAPPTAVAPPRPVGTAAHQDTAPAIAPTAAPVACGEEGQPPCPLQGWMERNLQAAVEAADVARVGRGLARAAKFAPLPDWNSGDQGWARIAETGAAAANAGDLATARQSCKGCHKAWRAKYKAGFRMRPIAE